MGPTPLHINVWFAGFYQLSLVSLKPDDIILKSFKVTGLCPVLIVCCPR